MSGPDMEEYTRKGAQAARTEAFLELTRFMQQTNPFMMDHTTLQEMQDLLNKMSEAQKILDMPVYK